MLTPRKVVRSARSVQSNEIICKIQADLFFFPEKIQNKLKKESNSYLVGIKFRELERNSKKIKIFIKKFKERFDFVSMNI